MTNNNAHIWHADDGVVARYAAGSLPEPDAWSLETHVEQCSRCAVRVSRAVGATAAGTVLREVREAVLGALPAQGAAQGSARIPASGAPACEGAAGQRRPGLPKVRRLPRLRRTARLLWAAGPAVRGAWLPAVLVVAAGALVLGQGAGSPARGRCCWRSRPSCPSPGWPCPTGRTPTRSTRSPRPARAAVCVSR